AVRGGPVGGEPTDHWPPDRPDGARRGPHRTVRRPSAPRPRLLLTAARRHPPRPSRPAAAVVQHSTCCQRTAAVAAGAVLNRSQGSRRGPAAGATAGRDHTGGVDIPVAWSVVLILTAAWNLLIWPRFW